MPARRPYASRGVPRRVTTRRTSRPAPRVLLAGLLVILLVAGTFTVRAFASGSTNTGGSNPSAASSGSGAPAASQLSALAPANANTSSPTQTAPATQRQWATDVPGITNDPVLAS